MNGLEKAYQAVYDLTAYIAAELENVLPDSVLDYLISEYPNACQAGVTYLMQDDNPGDGLVGMYQDVAALQTLLIKGLCWHWARTWTHEANEALNELWKSQRDALLAEPHSARALTPFEVVTADLHKATPALEERATAAIQEQRRQQEQEFVEEVEHIQIQARDPATVDLGESGSIQTAQEEPIQGMKDIDTLIHELAMCYPEKHQQEITYEMRGLLGDYE